MIAIALLLLLLSQSVQHDSATAAIARGEKIFAQSCPVGYCHGVAGAAGRGPRLRGRSFSKDYLLNVTRDGIRSEEHTSELQSHVNLVCRLLLDKKKPGCPP